jgi:putative phosphoribosyl transferase
MDVATGVLLEETIRKAPMLTDQVTIPMGAIRLEGELVIPSDAKGIVLFAHGSGSSRHSPRNQYVARVLHEAGIATLLFDLLTQEEEELEAYTRHLRFNIPLLAGRLVEATRWISQQDVTRHLNVGYFGSSTGAAAALVAAAELGDRINSVVSRGGRPDLAESALEEVTAATLLIVGGNDTPVITLNEEAYARLRCEKQLKLIPGATHLFEEAGALERVARLASEWFVNHFHPVEHHHS